MAFLTGRYPRSVGVTLSPTPLPEDEATIGRLLRDGGVRGGRPRQDALLRPARREFDRCVDLREHEAWLAAMPPEPIPPGIEVLGPWRPFYDPASVWLNGDCLPYAPDAEMPDTFFAGMAERFLPQERSEAVLPLGRLLRDPLAVPLPDRVPGPSTRRPSRSPRSAPEDVDGSRRSSAA